MVRIGDWVTYPDRVVLRLARAGLRVQREPAGWPDRFQRKHPWAGFPLAVAYKYFDDYFGAYLAALLTYYGFVSLFPLLLLSTVLGLVLSGHPRLQHKVLTSALHQFPVIGGDLARSGHLGGGPAGLVAGIAGSLYGGLGVAQVFQYASRPSP